MAQVTQAGTVPSRPAGAPLTGLLPRTERVVRRGLDSGLHLGAQIAVYTRDGSRLDLVLGQARPDREMAADSLVPYFCASRPALTLALARLTVTAGLDFDQRVADYLPEFAVGGKQDVTVRQLLLHTTGIRVDPAAKLRGEPFEVVLEAMCEAPVEPGWTPGEQAAYLRFGYWYLAGELVARVAGQPLSQYLRRELFEPLGMTDTWAGMPEDVYEREYGRLVTVLRADDGMDHELANLESPHFCCGRLPFGPRGTAADLAWMYWGLLHPERLGGFLPPELARSLYAPARIGRPDHGWVSSGGKVDWTLAGMLESRRYGRAAQLLGRGASERAFGHYGRHVTVGFADPDRGLAAAFCVNGMVPPVPGVLRTQALCSAIFDDVAEFEGSDSVS